MGSVVRLFLKVCSKPRNLITDAHTDGCRRRPPFVRSDCRVKLATEAAVYLNLAVVVYPRNTELDHTLRLNDTIDYAVGLVGRILCNNRLQRHQHFADCLQEFRLIAVALYTLSYTF